MPAMAGVKRPFQAMLTGTSSHHHNHLPHLYNSGHLESSTTTGNHRKQRVSCPPDTTMDATTRTPSPSFPPLSGEIPDFGADASIVLVGIRGAGKSTLAIMASSAMKRKVVDLETAFQRACGVSSANYRRDYGTPQCHRQQAKVLQSVFEKNPTDSIIVCSWMESRIQALLREFASTHPVIHVVRDAGAIQDHLKIQDRGKMDNLLNVSRAIFRTCTNFEFFNVSERQLEPPDSSTNETLLDRLPAPYLALKQAERHLLKFLSLIFPPGAIPFIESAFPLATIPPEQLQFTYALSVSLPDVLRGETELEEQIEGADVVQILVDDLLATNAAQLGDGIWKLAEQITEGIGVARRGTVLPLALHIELPESPSEEAIRHYLELVSHSLRLAPELITINLRLNDKDISRIVAARGRSKIVGDCSINTDPPLWESSTWTSLYEKASRLGCDMARLVRPATSFNDNLAVNTFRATVKSLDCESIPLITYNSGTLGRMSACFNPILTPVAPRTPSGAQNTVLTAQKATKALAASFVYDKMKLYVFGFKVGYSMSPAMHNSALASCGLPHHYTPHSTESLSAVKHLIEDPNFGGASIGLPFKVEVITLIHSLSRHAQAIGAVNTLIPVRHLNADGSLPQGGDFFKAMGRAGPVKALYGENTDWIGIRACIRRGLSPANAVRPGSCGLLIGAGGMARAALYAMLQVGIQNIVLYNRTLSNAEKLAKHFSQLLQKPEFQSLGAGQDTRFHVIHDLHDDWPSDFSLPTVIISCIPTHRIGSVPAPDFTVPEEWLGSRTGGVIIELGYKTLDTPLLAQAKREASRGWIALTGLDLLPEQGFAQFELFTGKRAPRKIMRRDLLRAYRDEKGFMHDELQSRMPSEVRETT